MPQKLNPDVAELARGKAGTAIGRLTGLLATVKSLPLAYDRDLQEDKPPVFAARRDVAGALGALSVLVAGLEFDHERLAAASADPLLRATDAAEALVAEGLPFRDAHEQVAGQVRAGTFEAPPAGNRPRRCRRRGRRRKGALDLKRGPHDDTTRGLAGGTRLPAHLRPRPGGGGSDPRPRGRAARESEAAAPAGRDARPLLREALDAHTRLVLGRDGAARRRRVHLAPEELQLSRGESLPDTARALSGYLDALAVRVHSHAELEEWAHWASIPVINALTAEEHPCQALADALTMRDRLGSLDGVRVAWVGDGSNVCTSLAAARSAARLRGDRRLPGRLRAGRRRVTSCATRARPCAPPT